MFERLDVKPGKVVGIKISGKLTDDDYKSFTPEMETIIAKEGKLRLLCVVEDFHGWTPKAMWDDLKFDIKHHSACERLAVVGTKAGDEWMAKFSKPFIHGDVKYFDHANLHDAWEWINEGVDGA
jgi:hypothetical protein